jgi:M6 family metalloprotease-like protein
MFPFIQIVNRLTTVKKAAITLILLLIMAGLATAGHANQPATGNLIRPDGRTALSPTGVIGPQHWATIMCKFSDVTAEPQTAAFFKDMFERSNGPSLANFWREVSYNNIPNMTTDVYGWYTLPHDRAYYGFSETTPGYDAGGIVDDCTTVAHADVNFNNYDAVAIMLNSPAPVAITTAFYIFPGGAQLDINPITIPSNKYNLALVAHEMGHGYWLDHSSANGEEYANPWDLMGIPSSYRCWVNADPVYGCLGQHIIAVFKDQLGWIPADKKFEAPQGTSTITLERLAQPQTDNYLMATIQSGFNIYTIEARQRVGYDSKLAGDAVLIHHGSDLIDADGAPPYDDEGAMWRPGETYTNNEAGFSVTVESATASGFVITIDNQNQPGPTMDVQLSANPTAPIAGEQVDFDAFVFYQDPNLGSAANVMITVTFPSELTYVPGSASTSIGSVLSENPLVFAVGTLDFAPVFLSYAATVNEDVTEPTAVQIPVEISWDGGHVSDSHRLIVNAEQVYLPIILR